MNRCSKSGIHEHSPNSQVHNQIFHRIDKWFSIDRPDHEEDVFHIVRCVRRYVEMLVPRRFRILLMFLVNWWTGSVCNGVHPSFTILGNRFFSVVPGLSLRIVGVFWMFFFSMRRVSRCISINLPRYASFRRNWEVDAASSEFGSHSSCCRVSPKLSTSQDFRCNRIWCGRKNLSQ